MEIKKISGRGGRLYLMVSMTKVKAGVLGRGEDFRLPALPDTSFVYSLSDIFKNINPVDKHFLKYLPDGFLDEKQKAAKQLALKEDKERIDGYERKFAYGKGRGGRKKRNEKRRNPELYYHIISLKPTIIYFFRSVLKMYLSAQSVILCVFFLLITGSFFW